MDEKNKILALKKKKNAIILAHYYQNDEIQEIADYVGDSFGLSKKAKEIDCDIIVFCGVRFMAESAKILNPNKKVLLPSLDAGCPMADMVTKDDVLKLKEQYPNAAVVCYVNTSAEVKSVCDVCCTSSNAINIVSALENEEIIFVPDENLASFVEKNVKNKKMIKYQGYCITHKRVLLSDLEKAKRAHPDALVLVHPECTPLIVALADFVGSTEQIIEHATNSRHNKFIIGTEQGILYSLKNKNPNKTFYLLSPKLICPNMKKTNLKNVLDCLENLSNEIKLDAHVMNDAYYSLDRMLKSV